MATLTTSDCLQKSRVYEKTDGRHAIRVFLVSNCGVAGQPAGRQFDALTPIGVPSPGDQHPNASDLYCSEVSVELADANTNDQMIVTATYDPANVNNRAPSTTGICQFEAGATVAKKKYFTNNSGLLMSVVAVVGANTLPAQPIEAEIDYPIPYLHLSRLEPFPGEGAKILAFVGRVNSVDWNPGFFTATKRTALCTAIRATVQNYAVLFKYEFQYAFDTFDVIAAYIDPQTKVPILNGLTGNNSDHLIAGIPAFRVYPEVDFAQLKLNSGSP